MSQTIQTVLLACLAILALLVLSLMVRITLDVAIFAFTLGFLLRFIQHLSEKEWGEG